MAGKISKNVLIANGDSEWHAECFVNTLVRFESEKFANFVCSPIGISTFFICLFFICIILCVCVRQQLQRRNN